METVAVQTPLQLACECQATPDVTKALIEAKAAVGVCSQ